MKLLQVILASAIPFFINCSNENGAIKAIYKSVSADLSHLDGILETKDGAAIERFFNELGNQTIESNSARIFLKVISKGSVDAYDSLIKNGADPFKIDVEYKMSAFDFVTVIPAAEMTGERAMIRIKIEKKWRELSKSKRRTLAAESMANRSMLYSARLANLKDYENLAEASNQADCFKMTFVDGSSPIHQFVIGNNLELLTHILAQPDVNVNELWTRTDVEPDIKAYGSIDPVGWTPLMLAVAFNRLESVRKLLGASGIDLSVKSEKYDVFYLARRLPLAQREIMLPVLRKALPPINAGNFTNLKAAIEGGASDDSINYHLDRSEAVSIDILRTAVAHLTDENILKAIFSEGETLFEEKTIHKSLWEALKLDTKTKSVEGFKRKLEIMSSYGFMIDERKFHVEASGGMTPLEEVYRTSSINMELSIAAVQFSKDVNSLSFNTKAPIVFALESGKVELVKYMLRDARELGLDVDIECNEAKENLLHYALTLDIIKERDLLEIVKLLLEMRPQFLNLQSTSTTRNEVSYNFKNENVTYSILKRSKWTPLMYAVMMRRNEVAKYMIEKGADRNIKGWDGVDVNEIIKARCDAFTKANPPPSPIIDPRKEQYNKGERARISKSIAAEMDKKYSY